MYWFYQGYTQFSQSIDGTLAAAVGDDGSARGHGAIHIRDEDSSTTLVSDGSADATCADSDGDGTAGLVRLSFGLQDARTGEFSLGVVFPTRGDIDESGRYRVRFLYDSLGQPTQEFEGWLRVRFFGR